MRFLFSFGAGVSLLLSSATALLLKSSGEAASPPLSVTGPAQAEKVAQLRVEESKLLAFYKDLKRKCRTEYVNAQCLGMVEGTTRGAAATSSNSATDVDATTFDPAATLASCTKSADPQFLPSESLCLYLDKKIAHSERAVFMWSG